MSWELRVRGDFSAAHALRAYQGKCERLHGHNFTAEICVRGDKLRKPTDILLDFGELKKILKTVLAELDHHCLNNTPPFDSLNPSSENLARHIFNEVEKLLPAEAKAYGVKLLYASVSEKEGQSASWLPDETD